MVIAPNNVLLNLLSLDFQQESTTPGQRPTPPTTPTPSRPDCTHERSAFTAEVSISASSVSSKTTTTLSPSSSPPNSARKFYTERRTSISDRPQGRSAAAADKQGDRLGLQAASQARSSDRPRGNRNSSDIRHTFQSGRHGDSGSSGDRERGSQSRDRSGGLSEADRFPGSREFSYSTEGPVSITYTDRLRGDRGHEIRERLPSTSFDSKGRSPDRNADVRGRNLGGNRAEEGAARMDVYSGRESSRSRSDPLVDRPPLARQGPVSSQDRGDGSVPPTHADNRNLSSRDRLVPAPAADHHLSVPANPAAYMDSPPSHPSRKQHLPARRPSNSSTNGGDIYAKVVKAGAVVAPLQRQPAAPLSGSNPSDTHPLMMSQTQGLYPGFSAAAGFPGPGEGRESHSAPPDSAARAQHARGGVKAPENRENRSSSRSLEITARAELSREIRGENRDEPSPPRSPEIPPRAPLQTVTDRPPAQGNTAGRDGNTSQHGSPDVPARSPLRSPPGGPPRQGGDKHLADAEAKDLVGGQGHRMGNQALGTSVAVSSSSDISSGAGRLTLPSSPSRMAGRPSGNQSVPQTTDSTAAPALVPRQASQAAKNANREGFSPTIASTSQTEREASSPLDAHTTSSTTRLHPRKPVGPAERSPGLSEDVRGNEVSSRSGEAGAMTKTAANASGERGHTKTSPRQSARPGPRGPPVTAQESDSSSGVSTAVTTKPNGLATEGRLLG